MCVCRVAYHISSYRIQAAECKSKWPVPSSQQKKSSISCQERQHQHTQKERKKNRHTLSLALLMRQSSTTRQRNKQTTQKVDKLVGEQKVEKEAHLLVMCELRDEAGETKRLQDDVRKWRIKV